MNIFAGQPIYPMKFVVIFLLLLSLLSSCHRTTEDGDRFPVQKVRELTLRERTLQKAREALVFCRENGMNTDFCFLVDMGQHSGKDRFRVWDFKKDSVVDSGLCAHGYGENSTHRYPVFSNVSGSYCTSLGKYKTGARAYSNWGIHVHYKLHGLEETNNRAFERLIVLHSHTPIADKESYPYPMPLGYSQGCPVVSDAFMKRLDQRLKNSRRPTLLWIYNRE